MPLTAAALTSRIETEFVAVWNEMHRPGPPPSSPDLQLLFAAVARGVLGYLKANEAELITQLTGTEASSGTLTNVKTTLGIGS